MNIKKKSTNYLSAKETYENTIRKKMRKYSKQQKKTKELGKSIFIVAQLHETRIPTYASNVLKICPATEKMGKMRRETIIVPRQHETILLTYDKIHQKQETLHNNMCVYM